MHPSGAGASRHTVPRHVSLPPAGHHVALLHAQQRLRPRPLLRAELASTLRSDNSQERVDMLTWMRLEMTLAREPTLEPTYRA